LWGPIKHYVRWGTLAIEEGRILQKFGVQNPSQYVKLQIVSPMLLPSEYKRITYFAFCPITLALVSCLSLANLRDSTVLTAHEDF